MYIRIVSFSLVLAVAGAAHAQSGRRSSIPPNDNQPGPSIQTDAEIRLDVDEVRLNVKVYDSAGRSVRGLDRSNFIVAENGIRQSIASFASERAPTNVVLVLDSCSDVYTEVDAQGSVDRPKPIVVNTPSILDRVLGPPYEPPPIRIDRLADLAFARRIASDVIERLGPNDRISVIQASRKVELLQDWTGDHAEARHAVNWRFKLGDATAIWDAVYLASSEQLSKVEGQRIMIVVSDGVDTASRVSQLEAAAALDRTGTCLYVLSSSRVAIQAAERYLDSEGQILAPRRRQATTAIEALQNAEGLARGVSERSGGVYYALASDADSSTFVSTIFDELQTAYVLSYVSSNDRSDGSWRSIAVYFDRPSLTARTRRGYYASPRRL